MEEIEFLEDNFSQSAPYNYNKKKKKEIPKISYIVYETWNTELQGKKQKVNSQKKNVPMEVHYFPPFSPPHSNHGNIIFRH